jgi:hypothetical protein
MSRLSANAVSLKDFMRKVQVLTMYRSMNRATRKIENSHLQQSLLIEIRDGFRMNCNMSDPMTFKSTMIECGRQLKQLQAMSEPSFVDPTSWINQESDDGEEHGRVGVDWPWEK